MRRFMKEMAIGLALLMQSGSLAAAADVTLNALYMKQAAYSEDNVRAMTADFEKANPGTKVNLEFVPYEALHDKIVAAQGAGSSGYDVVLFDVIWPAEFGTKGFLQDVTARIPADETAKVFDGAWTTVDYDGKRWGMPWILDTKYLFYNEDMLKQAGIAAPPKTFEELAEQAKIIKDKGIVKFPIVWSWAQAEALICDYTSLVAAYQGTFFTDGKPSFDSGGSLDAVKYMKKTLDDGLTNPNSREYLEEDVRKVFSSGEAAFALNWTYMYNLANDPKESKIAGKVGIVPAPGAAGKSEGSAVNGSMGLGIAASSQHADDAWKYITFMTAQETQNKYAKLSLPIWKSSYDDPAVTAGQEKVIAAAKTSLGLMFARPATPSYPELSAILQKNIQQVAARPGDAGRRHGGSGQGGSAAEVAAPAIIRESGSPHGAVAEGPGGMAVADADDRHHGSRHRLPAHQHGVAGIHRCQPHRPGLRLELVGAREFRLHPRRCRLPRGGRAHRPTSRSFRSRSRWCSACWSRCCSTRNSVGRTAVRALLILPWALPTIVNAVMWRLIYNPEFGSLNALLTQARPARFLPLLARRSGERHERDHRRRHLEELSADRADRARRPADHPEGSPRGGDHGRRRRLDALLEHHLPRHPRARSAWRWCCAPSRPSRCSTSST